MQYLYHKDAKESSILLKGDEYRYIFRVRRHNINDRVVLRNLKDNRVYQYRINSISKRDANLILESSKELTVEAKHKLHIGWCIIEPKSIESTISTLNEIGVSSITFIYCKRSQKNFKLDFRRLEKILINSSQQSGRSKMMRLNIVNNIEEFLSLYPDAKIVNFSKNRVDNWRDIKSIIIGCEGGFSDSELKLFSNSDIVGLDTPMILKSKSATIVVASKILC